MRRRELPIGPEPGSVVPMALLFPEYDALDGLGIAELVRRRQVSPAEVTDVTLRAHRRAHSSLNAVVRRFDAGACEPRADTV
jgi:hypothetical protein